MTDSTVGVITTALAGEGFRKNQHSMVIMRHGRWRSVAVMCTYIPEADRHRVDSPIIALGLDAASISGDRAGPDIPGSSAAGTRR